MGWETRNGRGAYYTRSRRQGGRIVREYVGAGLAAELAAMIDQAARDHRQRQAARLRRLKAEDEALDAQTEKAAGLAKLLAQAALVAAGYHQHHRGEWRRKRRGKAQA